MEDNDPSALSSQWGFATVLACAASEVFRHWVLPRIAALAREATAPTVVSVLLPAAGAFVVRSGAVEDSKLVMVKDITNKLIHWLYLSAVKCFFVAAAPAAAAAAAAAAVVVVFVVAAAAAAAAAAVEACDGCSRSFYYFLSWFGTFSTSAPSSFCGSDSPNWAW